MAEYKLTYHKFPRFSTKEEHERFESLIHPKERKDDAKSVDRDMITLGNFDRLTIEQEHSFTRARDFSLFSRGWNGDRLSLLLYDLGEGDALEELGVQYDGKQKLCYFGGSDARFVVMTFFNLSDRLIPVSFDATERLHRFLLEKMDNISKDSGVRCALMGCFGMADYCLVTLTDNYAEALKLAEKLKAVQVKNGGKDIFLFSEFYTCVSLNRGHKALSDLDRPAVLYVATKGVLSAEAFQSAMLKAINDTELSERLAESELQYVFGEYDLALRAEAQYLIPLIEKGKPFHFSSKFYQDTVLRTQIQLLTEPTEKGMSETWELPEGFYFLGEGELVCSFKEIRNLIEGDYGLRKQLKRTFPPSSCFVDDFDALYHDFRNYLFSAAKLQRRLDCAYRFYTVLQLIREKVEGSPPEGSMVSDNNQERENIRKLMEVMNTHLRQERGVTMLELDSPLCQSNFNGHQDMILHGYNNYLKELLSLLYRRKDQPKLVPLVTSSTVFQILSTQYSGTVKGESVSLLLYELPTAVMTDLPFGLASILHETFHYVPPSSREARNIHTACIFLCELTLHYYCQALAGRLATLPGQPYVASMEIGFANALYALCVGDEAFPNFVISVHKNLVSQYDAQFAQKNPKHYFKEFCGILTDSLTQVGDTNLFAKCLQAAENCFFEMLQDYEFTPEGSEKAYRVQADWSQAVKKEFSDSLRDNGDYYMETYMIEPYKEILLDPYREAKADIGMLSVTGMNLTDYFLIYTENLLLVQRDGWDIPRNENLRLLLVVRFLKRSTTVADLRENKGEFVRRYISRSLARASGEWTEEKTEQKLKEHYPKLLKEANRTYDAFVEAFEEAERSIGLAPYGVLLDAIIKLMDPEDTLKNTMIPVSGDLLYETRKYFSSMRQAEMICKDSLPVEELEPDEASGIEGRDQRILNALKIYRDTELKESLEFIRKLQKTCLLANIKPEKQGGFTDD